MTDEEAVVALKKLLDNNDAEAVHIAADNILLKFIRSAKGGKKVADAYEEMKQAVSFWYA